MFACVRAYLQLCAMLIFRFHFRFLILPHVFIYLLLFQEIIFMANSGTTLFLNGQEVEKYLHLNDLINGIEKSFVQFSNKVEGIQQPLKVLLPLYDDNLFVIKPACSLTDKTLSSKLLTLYPNNEKKYGLPALQSIVVVFNSDTGSLEAVMDGISVTDLRTAAASAVAVKHLSPNRNILAIIGTGHQGVSHVKLMRELKGFKEIRVFSRCKERRDDFAKRWNVIACDSVEGTVANADVVVTVTSSKSAVLFNKWVKPNALVVIVGAPEPTAREVDDDLMHNSQVIADSLEAAKACGDVSLSGAIVHGELGDVITGRVLPDWNKIRVFKSTGMALQDLVAGRIVVDNYNKAMKYLPAKSI